MGGVRENYILPTFLFTTGLCILYCFRTLGKPHGVPTDPTKFGSHASGHARRNPQGQFHRVNNSKLNIYEFSS